MKKILAFVLAFVCLFAFSVMVTDHGKTAEKSAYSFSLAPATVDAGWTISTNWTGKWTAKITLVADDLSNSSATNYNLSKGFLKGKVVPNDFHVTYISNGPTVQSNLYQVVRIVCQGPNATNFAVRVIPAKGTSMNTYRYIKFILFMQYIRPGLR